MLFPVWLSHVSCACTALSKHGVGVEPPFWPDFWDRSRACARGGGSSPSLRVTLFCGIIISSDSSHPCYQEISLLPSGNKALLAYLGLNLL